MADRYWVGGSASWDGTAGTKWATTSGGAGGAAVPTTSDNVFLDANSGAVTVTVASGNTGCANLNCTGFTGTLAGSAAIDIRGSLTLVAGMTHSYTGAVTFSATTSVNLTFGGKTFNSTTTFDGVGGTWTLQDNWNNSAKSITLTRGTLDTNGKTYTSTAGITGSGTNTRGLTLGASTINCFSWTFTTTTNLTFSVGTSIIIMSGNGAGTFAGGGLTYNEVRIQNHTVLGDSANTSAITGANTFAILKRTNTNMYCALRLAADQIVTGDLQIIGNNATTQRQFVRSSLAGTQRTITCNGTITLTNVDFQDIVGAGSASWSGTSIGDAGNNSGITMTAAVTRYWVGGTGVWTNTSEWAASSGGASGASVPLPQDTAIFDGNSFSAGSQTVSISSANVSYVRLCAMDWTGATNTPTFNINDEVIFCGSVTFISGMNIGAGTSNIEFQGRGSCSVTMAGKSFVSAVRVETGTGTLTLNDDFATTLGLTHGNGTFDLNDQDVTAATFNGGFTDTRIFSMGSGTFTLTGTGTVWTFSAVTNLTFNAETSTIKITNTSATARTFAGLGQTYYNLWSDAGASTASLTVSGSNTFNDFKDTGTAAHSILFTTGTTQTVTTFTVSGSSGNLITINSTTTGVHTLSKSSGVVSCDYLNIQHSAAQGGATWYAGANSTNNQGVATAGRGWHFSVPDNGHNFGMMLTQ